jgi:hypothetical protein
MTAERSTRHFGGGQRACNPFRPYTAREREESEKARERRERKRARESASEREDLIIELLPVLGVIGLEVDEEGPVQEPGALYVYYYTQFHAT